MSNTSNTIKKGMLAVAAIAVSISTLTSCDQHEIEDLSWHSWEPGMVYTTNGDVLSYEKCQKEGKQPEAVLFYVDKTGETDAYAYAVTLKDAIIVPSAIPTPSIPTRELQPTMEQWMAKAIPPF